MTAGQGSDVVQNGVTIHTSTIGSWTTTISAWGKSSSTTSDYFGKLVSGSDFGGHTSGYNYNLAGQLTEKDKGVRVIY